MRWSWCVIPVLLVACGGKRLDPQSVEEPLDVVLIPGCPSHDDGTLSGCQWQRAIWGAALWREGVTTHLITSGNAVQNPYIEAEALAEGLVAMGVPRDAIYTETQALHSDQNAGYSLAMMEVLGFDTVGVASHGGHADGIRAMLEGWGHPAASIPIDEDLVVTRMRLGLPDVRTEPVPADEWLPLRERKRVLRERTGHGRPPSWWVYTWMTLSGPFTQLSPPVPPVPEPTLDGERHRVDTRPWDEDGLAAK